MTCPVLTLARQPSYRWLKQPITESERVEAYRANALLDAHRDDPGFGHRRPDIVNRHPYSERRLL